MASPCVGAPTTSILVSPAGTQSAPSEVSPQSRAGLPASTSFLKLALLMRAAAEVGQADVRDAQMEARTLVRPLAPAGGQNHQCKEG